MLVFVYCIVLYCITVCLIVVVVVCNLFFLFFLLFWLLCGASVVVVFILSFVLRVCTVVSCPSSCFLLWSFCGFVFYVAV